MLKRTALFIVVLLLASCFPAQALMIRKTERPIAHAAPHLRNALTDVSLTQTYSPAEQAPAHIHISLADAPDDTRDGNLYHSTYHGKHVTALVFLSLSALFLIAGIVCIKASRDDIAGTLFSAVGGTMGFLGFGIPGAIKLVRYPRNQPKVKE